MTEVVALKGNMFTEPVEFPVLTKEQLMGLYALKLDVRQMAFMEDGYKMYVLFIGVEPKYFASRG